jgi:tetratricopeptide (TPR) repeat protein
MDAYMLRFPGKIDKNFAELRLRLLLSSGRKKDAFAWAKKWLNKHQNLSMRYMALLYSGGVSGNMNTALASTEVVELVEIPNWLIDVFMKQNWVGEKLEPLEKFVSHLGEEKFRDYPVAMASLAVKQKNKEAIQKWLTLAESKTDLTPQQQVNLMQVYFKLNKVSEGMFMLSKLTEQTEISPSLLVQSAMLIMKTGNINEGAAIFQSLRRHQKDKNSAVDKIIDKTVDEAWALLASAAGETKEVSQWLEQKRNKETSIAVLKNLYYAAADRAHFRLASIIGRHLYSRTRAKAEAQLLTTALQSVKKRTAEESDELGTLMNTQQQIFDLSRKERRELAFQLLRMGERKKAIQQFQRLAKTQGPQGKDVKQLLYLWGATPASAALDWLQARAKKSPDNKLSGWWQHLVQTGGAERVIEMREGVNRRLPVEAEGALINALVTVGNFSGAEKRLQVLAKNTKDNVRLELLAEYANRAGLTKAEEIIWRKLSRVQPMNTKAMRELGVAAFERGDLLAAGGYLSQYLSLTEGDWEAALCLGDVSLAYDRQADAQLNYKKSLALLDKGLGEIKQKNIARAHLLYQLDKTKEAINAYDKLIFTYPEDVELRARYSDLLINEGQLDKARLLLVGKQ